MPRAAVNPFEACQLRAALHPQRYHLRRQRGINHPPLGIDAVMWTH
jgi:hypothetical protein